MEGLVPSQLVLEAAPPTATQQLIPGAELVEAPKVSLETRIWMPDVVLFALFCCFASFCSACRFPFKKEDGRFHHSPWKW